MILFRDRREAGRRLVPYLSAYADRADVIVLAHSRGGVPVAVEVAQALFVALDVFAIGKIEVPDHAGLVLGAVATGGVILLDHELVSILHISQAELEALIMQQLQELERYDRAYRDGRPAPEIEGRTVILVDDGLTGGIGMRMATTAVRHYQPARLVVAVPATSPQARDEYKDEVDDFICVVPPHPVCALGTWYHDVSLPTDREAQELLQAAGQRLQLVTRPSEHAVGAALNPFFDI